MGKRNSGSEFVDAVEVSEAPEAGAVSLRESAREAAKARLQEEIENGNLDKLVPDSILPKTAISAPNEADEVEEVDDEDGEIRVDAESVDPKDVKNLAVLNADGRARDKSTGKFVVKITPEAIDAIIRSYTFLDSDEEVAAVCGVNRSTIYRLRESNPTVAAQIEAAKMTKKTIAKKKLFQGLRNGGFAESLQILAIEEPEKYSPRAKIDVNNKHSAEGTLADILSKMQNGEIPQTLLAQGAAKQMLPEPASTTK